MFFPEFQPRIQTVETLQGVLCGTRSANELAGIAKEFEGLAERLSPSIGPVFATYGELVRAAAHLHLWGAAVRNAESDADRHLRAARQRARDVVRKKVGGSAGQAVSKVAQRLAEVSELEEVEICFEDLLAIRLPLPFKDPAKKEQFYNPEPTPEAQDDSGRPVVAFLQFALGNTPLAEPQDIRANILYDLSVEVRLSRWPIGVKAIEVTPFSVEPHGTVEAPTFTIEQSNSGDLSFSRTGRLFVRLAHDALARPLEISYGVYMLPSEASQSSGLPDVMVQSRSHLLLRCEEHGHPWRGNKAIHESISRIREEARRHGLSDEELSPFLALLGSIGLVADESLASNVFPGQWREADFQERMRNRLRASIGPDLEEHAHAAGGVTDLSLHRIRLELKVDQRPINLDNAYNDYGQQIAQYAVGSDRRCGVLAVLCRTLEGAAPGSLENDIGLRVIPPPTGGNRGVLLGIVLIRSDLPKPSSLSRRS